MLFSHRHQAFTLLEVLVVIAIMSIVAVSGFSSIINLQRTARVNQSQQQFKNFLILARSYAIGGKTVSGPKSGCGTASCNPKYFGVRIDASTSDENCQPSSSKAVMFYVPITLPSYSENKIVELDSFCLEPQVAHVVETAQGKISNMAFLYESPLGTFSTSKSAGTNSEITLSFCDNSGSNSGCDKNSYTKTITLFPNIGIPE